MRKAFRDSFRTPEPDELMTMESGSAFSPSPRSGLDDVAAPVPTPALRFLRVLTGVLGLVYVLTSFLRVTTSVDYGDLDSSWLHTLHVAFASSWQFGRDVVIVLGPWGFLLGGHHPATATVSLTIWTALAILFWCGAWRIACHSFSRPSVALLWLIGFTAAASIPPALSVDGRMAAFVSLVLLLHFFVDRRRPSFAQVALVGALGLLALTKFTVLMLAALSIGIVTLDAIVRRRVPWQAPLWLSTVALCWTVAGQRPATFADYLLNSWRLSAGYTDAMSLDLPGGWLFAAAFVVIAAMVVASVVLAGRVLDTRTALLAGAGFAGVAAIEFKNGYVRHDFHDVGATMALLVLALGACAALSPRRRAGGSIAHVVFVGAPLAALILASFTQARGGSVVGVVSEAAATVAPARFASAFRLLAGGNEGEVKSEQRLALVRQSSNLPPIQGDVDAYPWNQLQIFAHGLAYQPRPVTQSYSTYSPELAELNAAHLRGDRAASSVLFEVAPTDGRLPALEDGRAWLELLARYDFAASDGTRLLLRRATKPRSFETIPVGDASIAFGETVSVPSPDGGLLWARVDVDKTLVGEVVSALWKLPPIELTVSVRGGQQYVYRLVPGMARSGFLLSPLVTDIKTFALLRAAEGINAVSASNVTGMTMTVAGKSVSPFYEPKFRVRLDRLVYATGP